MALFRKEEPITQPKVTEPLINEVFRLLDQIGVSRLGVRDPRIKVHLTQIAQNGEHRLTGGDSVSPSDAAVIEFRAHLESVVRVLAQYVEFQDNPTRYPDIEEMMSKGQQAIAGFASYVMEASIPGGTRNVSDFKVDADILSAQQHR